VAVVGMVAAAALVGLLILLFRPDLRQIGVLIAGTPFATIAMIAVVEGAILAAGAQKWRIVMRHLRPDVATPGFLRSVEATTVGSLLGQAVPAQISTAIARAAMQRRHAGSALAAWATMHEQIFEALALAVAVLVAAGILFLGLQPGLAALAGTATAVAVLVAARPLFVASAVVAGRCARFGPSRLAGAFGWLAAALRESASLPTRAGATLLTLSFLRIAGMMLRTVIACAAVAPQLPAAEVMIAFPLVQAATVLPVLPGGLGAVEWIWAMVLSGQDVSPAAAAESAIAIRIVCLLGLLLVAAVLVVSSATGLVLRRRLAR
jgi:uncharacterized membrane protein YbhN (UPF0104 family)